jgi:hypothetical protein
MPYLIFKVHTAGRGEDGENKGRELVHSQKTSCERKKRSHLAAKVHDYPGDYRS